MPQQFELRYRGNLLGFHPSETAAVEHATKHHGLNVKDKKDHHVEDDSELTIEPRRPITLFHRGALVDTFHSREVAEAERDRLLSEWTPRYPGHKSPEREDYAVVNGAEPPPVP